MSKRTLRDYIHSAFFARDKATLAQIVSDAESEVDHGEPDGDEGKHASNVHVHIEHKGAASGSNGNGDDDPDAVGDSGKLTDRLNKVETRVNSMDQKLDKVLDSIRGASKDDGLPPWLKKDGDDDDKGDDDKGDDDDKKDTDDDLPTGNTAGAQVAENLPSVEPELMEADPALKTGPSKMGDSAYMGRLSTAFRNLVQETKARAEILAPGIKFPTMDAKAGPHVAGVAICNLRRSALSKALADARTAPAVTLCTTDSVKTMSCDAVLLAFKDASDRVRAMNNARGRPSEGVYAGDGDPRATRDGVTLQIRAINAKNHEFWAKHGGLGPQGSVH